MTTKVLGEAVGIQWQGVQDHTQGQPSSNGVPLLIGSFKRGRTDKPMIIHNGNIIQSELGYEPYNPDYVAVQAMLDTGVPSVNVLRISDNGIPLPTPQLPENSISCAGATQSVILSRDGQTIEGEGFIFTINGLGFNNQTIIAQMMGSYFTDTLTGKNIDLSSIIKVDVEVGVLDEKSQKYNSSVSITLLKGNNFRIMDLQFSGLSNAWGISSNNANPCVSSRTNSLGERVFDMCLSIPNW